MDEAKITRQHMRVPGARPGRRGCFARGLTAALMAALLAACSAPPPPAPRVDVYKDHFEYLGDSYRSASALAVALEAANRQPTVVEVHACAALAKLEPALKAIRANGPLKARVSLPKNC
jgi:hypothetical protein